MYVKVGVCFPVYNIMQKKKKKNLRRQEKIFEAHKEVYGIEWDDGFIDIYLSPNVSSCIH